MYSQHRHLRHLHAPAYDAPAADVEVTANEAPPPLPDYEQPPCPEDGYMWTPGYWAWGGGGYYWVPGTWVQPPRVGVLWTPGYWGFVGGVYRFHVGYWGPHIGYYGGVNYGFGYVGVGFAGGRWVGNSFAYNRTVMNVNVTNVHNTYNETVINNVSVTKVSYNGGPGGTHAIPTAQERAVASEQHIPPTTAQHAHVQEAARNPALSARANGGHPAIAATPRPGAFNAPGVVGAHGAGMSPGAAQHAGQAGQVGKNGAQHTPGQPGRPGQANNFARPRAKARLNSRTAGSAGRRRKTAKAGEAARPNPRRRRASTRSNRRVTRTQERPSPRLGRSRFGGADYLAADYLAGYTSSKMPAVCGMPRRPTISPLPFAAVIAADARQRRVFLR